MLPDTLLASTEAFIREHHVWAGVIVGVLCFLESVAVVSLFVPATALLVVAGGLAGAGIISWQEVAIGGLIGCLLGDTVSYWLGRYLGPHANKVWPFATRPELLDQGQVFFRKHGWWGVFIGRFFGPLRAIVPTCAGIMGMPHWAFQGVSLASAIVFLPVVLAPGAIFGGMATGTLGALLPVLLAIALPVAIALVFAWRFKRKNAADIPDEAPPR
jgi:membrane protein DedA with SNARE-associated domain